MEGKGAPGAKPGADDPGIVPFAELVPALAAGVAQCEAAGVAMRPFAMSAVACLRAGLDLAQQGQFDDPITLQPLYAREPEAVRLWRERPS